MSEFLVAIETVRHGFAAVLILLGLIGLAAALAGQLRFPDLFTRLHALALAPLAAAAILAGLAFEAWDGAMAARFALLGALILALGPARVHMLASGAHGAGLTPLLGRLASVHKRPS